LCKVCVTGRSVADPLKYIYYLAKAPSMKFVVCNIKEQSILNGLHTKITGSLLPTLLHRSLLIF